MNWKKRSNEEIEKSVQSGDLTGGYDFLPWVVYMRLYFVIAILADIFIGYKLLQNIRESSLVSIIFGIFLGIGVPFLIMALLTKEFKRKKKGLSQ